MVTEKKSTQHDKFWCVPLPKGKTYKRFLDFQNDVAVSDVEIALKEGYRSIEHVKRYIQHLEWQQIKEKQAISMVCN